MTYLIDADDLPLFNFVEGTEFPTAYTNQIPRSIPSIKGQRWLDKKGAVKLLRAKASARGGRIVKGKTGVNTMAPQGGFDKGQYRPPYGMAVPVEVARRWQSKQKDSASYESAFNHGVKELADYAIFLFDGQKRTFMLNTTEEETLGKTGKYHPICIIYKADSVEKGNELFNDFNAYQLQKVSSESLFINDVLAGKANAVKLAERLEEVGLVITDKEDFFVIPEDKTNDKSLPRVQHNTWKVANDWFDWKPLKEAVTIIKEVINSSKSVSRNKSRITISAWWIHGLAQLFTVRPQLLSSPQPRKAMIEALLHNCYEQHNGNQKDMLDDIRAIGYKHRDGLDKNSIGVNTKEIWAIAFACVILKHGKKYASNDAIWQSTKISEIKDDLYPRKPQKDNEDENIDELEDEYVDQERQNVA